MFAEFVVNLEQPRTVSYGAGRRDVGYGLTEQSARMLDFPEAENAIRPPDEVCCPVPTTLVRL
ncbi:hypothetical protein GCM10010116_61800 [Microbispora rosea subsp. aerata]|nr:hypothetical protein GCM10010116_61800 [Microbispora rosea subsp. aerata]GIH59167.1 hypothetical protein Mro02_60810 [Microbispora rosea subsp. aerata]GLJ86776.1 hypothetical protein GCM10017588_55170 [Microbispora rosea subsp. aerata]